jgi:O-antigen ligase
MKELFIIDDSLKNKISYYHLACFVIAIPFDSYYGGAILASFTIHTLIHLQKERLRLLLNKGFFILISLYLSSLFGLIYSQYKDDGIFLLTTQFSFLLLPILFTLNTLDFEKYKMRLVKIFGLTCAGIVIYLFADSLKIIGYYHLPLSDLFAKEFINQNFSQVLKLHSTYFSMDVGLSLSAFIYFLIIEPGKPKKIVYSVLIFIFIAGLIQLSSRAVVIAEAIIILLAFPLLVVKGKNRVLFLSISVLFLTLISFLVVELYSFKERYIGELKDDLSQPSVYNKFTEPRVVRWQAEMELIKQSPVVGYGTGSEKEILKEKFFQKKLYLS